MRIATRMRIAGTWAATVVGLVIGNTAEVKADHMVYATADNGNGSNLFGTMDLTTGQFTQIATTTPLFGSLAAGPGGTLYGGAGSLNFGLYSISPSGVTSPFGTVTAPPLGLAPGFLGLASQGSAGFFADEMNAASLTTPVTVTFVHIASDGKSSSVVGATATFGSFNSGNLAFGPDGNLYFDAWNTVTSKVATLYQVDTNTGAATPVGSGLGSMNPLALVSVGATLYGIDTFTPTNPEIYTINTATGVATGIGTVSGLPTGYTLDTMASVPEPSAVTLFVTGVLGVMGLCRHRRCS